MGCCSSQPAQPPSGGFPTPLPAPMQDNMNELLNRWRHGEVNLLQRSFRLAKAQAVKHTIASKVFGSLAAPSSNSGTATSAATSANRDRSASFGEDGSASPASRDGAATATAELDGKKPGDGATGGSLKVGAGMDKEAFLRVFPDVQGLPVEVQRSAFLLFDCVGRGSLDFRNFCRALALCCRGSREERLRFLFDLFSGASQPKHYGTGADGGARDASSASGATTARLSDAELAGLKKQLGLSAGDANHVHLQKASGVSGLLLSEYFEWAELHASDEALDRALRPFYLLPSPQQEKDKVLAHLMEYAMEEGQCMCLVASPWWSYWSNYAALTKEDVLRVPERTALGLDKTQGYLDQRPAEEPAVTLVADEGDAAVRPGDVVGDGAASMGVGNGNGHAQGESPAMERLGGAGKERAVPTTLARRPHEIDNSSLQGGAEWEVAPNLDLGEDYVMLPKSLWDVMVDWYGGGPVFARQVVNVSSNLELPEKAMEGGNDAEAEPSTARLAVDLYPLALHVSMCDPAGRPGGRERLVLTSHHVHVRDMLADVLDNSRLQGMSRGLSMTAATSPQEDPVLESADVVQEQRLSEEGDVVGDEETPLRRDVSNQNRTGQVRLWVLEISTSGLIDTPRLHAPSSAPGLCRPRFSYGGGRDLGGVDPQSGLDRWRLVKTEEEGMTLSALGLVGGEKVMVENKNPDGKWQRRKYIESPGFRQFRENDRVDAMDYQGRWFRGQVVEVGSKSSSKIVDSEGPVGRKKSNRRQRLELDPPPEEPVREGANQELEHLEPSDASDRNEGRSAAKAGAGRSGSSQGQRQRRSSGKERDGGVGGKEGPRQGGPSRRRLRVRVHFDRFAPQWDEWYDSKSLKLAPEFSHTAPAVPAPPALRPTNEGNGDTEAEEEASPDGTAVRGGAGAPAPSSSKPGGSAFPPPVGRFPGDAPNGNGWGARSQSMPRTNGTGGTADGISNYGGGALNRRSNTPGKPPVPGACGLVNVGNTCYLNSAVQCLSHTPLVRAYLLSDMWAAEVNKYNPLGTQGKLVEDFASLLKSLWSQEYLCIFPSKFKRGLIKYKPQFAGNEQQDSQEFLAEMLDALHEDVNRVIDKPYVAAPDDDDAESGRSDQDLADEAWDRHVQRNRSVIVDLFQGQLKMECRCTVCNKKSVTFDPFMYLSVPIPVRNEKMVTVVMLPRIRTRYLVRSSGLTGEDGAMAGDGGAAQFSNPRQLVPVQYGMMLPRLGELSDLKRALSDLCGIPMVSLVVAILQQKQIKVMQDKELLTELRDDMWVIALEMQGEINLNRRAKPSTSTSSQATISPVPTPTSSGPTKPEATTAAGATAAGAAALSEEELPVGTEAEPTEPTEPTEPNNTTSGTPVPNVVVPVENGGSSTAAKGEGGAVESAEGGQGVSPERLKETLEEGSGVAETAAVETRSDGSEDDETEETDLDNDRPPTSTPDNRTPDERCTSSFPTRLRDLEIGWRLDALDGQGGWYAATVVEINPRAKALDRGGDKPSKASFSSKGEDQKRKTEYLVKVHFDAFTSRWDESYGEQEWRDKKLQPLFTKARRQERIHDVPVVHRKTIRVPTSGAHPQPASTRDVPGMRSEGDADGRDTKEPPPGFVTAKDLFGLPFLVRCPPARSTRYLWRLVVQQASRFVAGSSGGRSFKAGGKDRIARSSTGSRSRRPDVTAAWVARAAAGLERDITDEKLAQLLPFTVKFVLKQNPLTEVCSVELVPDRWRAASSLLCTKLILALEWKDPARDYLDVLAATFEHPSYLELENNAQSVLSGLTLEQCLDAYTREETLEEEDSWYCSSCQAHRRGVMKIDLWKMPDVLVIHMKRFHCSARWREKIRTLVLFPHSGLDMSGFVSSNSAHRNQASAGGGQAGMVYDLFGVVNHMGGMTGGHYTAYCRSSPCSKDGVEEVTGWGLEHPWLNFDDEFEMAPDKIVSDAAYVLFYRRRRLTPSNVINMTI
ncbi:unnamed protein product [Ectocarpus sp. 4 AP-2014]